MSSEARELCKQAVEELHAMCSRYIGGRLIRFTLVVAVPVDDAEGAAEMVVETAGNGSRWATEGMLFYALRAHASRRLNVDPKGTV